MLNKDSEKESISIAFVREALSCLSRRGLDPEPFAKAAGIPASLVQADAARVTAERFGALWLSIAQAMDDEFFGLDSRRMKVGSYATLGRLAIGGGSLLRALRRIAQFINIVLDDTRVLIEAEGAEARITLEDRAGRPAAEPGARVFAHETLFVLIHGLMSWLIGRRIIILRARFAYPAPAWSAEYHALFAADIAFGAGRSSSVFPAEALRAPVVQTERSLLAFLRGAPANFLLKYRDDSSLSSRVRHCLRDTAPDAWPSFERLARDLGVSASGLRRSLDREGLSFRVIKDALRRDRAIDHLTHSRLAIGDIASALGYAEPSAFHRAFKKWTGVSPGDYRDVHALTSR